MLRGIDISDFQDVNSFHAVQNGGFSFVYCKATEGITNTQATFADYRDRVRSIGLPFGAYHFLKWSSDPVEQARHFLSVYTPQNGDLPPMLDLEACGVESWAAMNQVTEFLQNVECHLDGQRMVLYMSFSFPNDHLRGGFGFNGHPLWVAAYNSGDKDYNTPGAWVGKAPGVLFHQFSDDLSVPGIPGAVDGDEFYGTQDDLNALLLKGL